MPRTLPRLLKAAAAAGALFTALLLALLYPPPQPARAEDIRPVTPWDPFFICPDRITLWDDVEQVEELIDRTIDVLSVESWDLYFQSVDLTEYGHASGSGPVVTDDRSGLRENTDYTYLLRYIFEERNRTTGITQRAQRTINYDRHTEPYCYGQIHSDYTFNQRDYSIIGIDVWQGFRFTLPAGASLRAHGASGGDIYLRHADSSALIQGTLVSTTLVISGANVSLRGAHMRNDPNRSGRGLSVSNGGRLFMTGGTLSHTDLAAYTGTVILNGVTGSLDVEQWPGSNVTVLNSTLDGAFYAGSSALLSVWNSTITGSVRAGPRWNTANPVSQATLISTTVLARDGCTNSLVRSETDAIVSLNRVNLDTRGQSSCSAVEAAGGQMRLWNGTANGLIRARGEGQLDAVMLEYRDGRLLASDDARVTLRGSRLESINNLYLYPGSYLTIADSSLVSTTLMLDGPTAHATFLRNDFTYTPDHYMLWLDRATGANVTMQGNCFFCRRAVWAPEGTGMLHLERNYWNHALGPNFPPANTNLAGAELSLSGSITATFQPFLEDAPAYCRTWPRTLPVESEETIGPTGGTLLAPGAVLVFPPGALAAPARMTWSQGGDSVAAAEADETALLARYRLAGTSLAAPPQAVAFQTPISLTLLYDVDQLGGAGESSLDLRRQVGAAWAPLAGTLVSPADRTLFSLLPEPGVYGLFGTVVVRRVYLPLCARPGP